MTQVLWIALALALPLSAQQAFFEEDLQLSRPFREANYRQLSKFVDNLQRQEVNRKGFLALIGYPAPGFYREANKPRRERIGEDSVGTYYRVWIEVAPQVETYGLYIVPKKARLPAPLVLSLHGGGGIPESALFHGGSNYHDQIRGAVEHGYVVWAPLFVMEPFADRGKGSPIPVDVRKQFDAKLRAAGTSLMAVECMKVTLALDRILEMPEVNARRVASIGLSYGGYYTLYLAAVEPRIKVAIASCSFRDTPAAKDGVTEGRPTDITSPDQVALVAPRPLQIQVGLHDPQAPIETVRPVAENSRRVYHKLSKADLFDYEEFDGAHEWNGELAWSFLAKHL